MPKLLNPFLGLATSAALIFNPIEANLNKAEAAPGCNLDENALVQYRLKNIRGKFQQCEPFVSNGQGYEYAGSILPENANVASITTTVKEGPVKLFGNGRADLEPALILRTDGGIRFQFTPSRVNGADVSYDLPIGGVAHIKTGMLNNSDYGGQKQVLIGRPTGN
jgi:hypothetical protein